jgi:hypothetical protein
LETLSKNWSSDTLYFSLLGKDERVESFRIVKAEQSSFAFFNEGKREQKMVQDAYTCIVLRLSDDDTKRVGQSFMALFEKVVGIRLNMP